MYQTKKLMKSLISLMLILVLASSAFGSYESLTSKERKRVIEAFHSAKYFNSLVLGRDSIEVVSVKKISSIRLSKEVEKRLYLVKAKITIPAEIKKRKVSKVIYRNITLSLDIKIVPSSSLTWHDVIIPAAALVAGYFAGRKF